MPSGNSQPAIAHACPSRQELDALKTAQFVLGELGVPLSHTVAEYVASKRLMPSHPLSEAAQHWAKDHARAPSVTFIQVAGEFLTHQHRALSERSYREEKIRVGRLQSALDVNMDDLSKSHIERFFSGVLTDHSGKTRNHYRQTLRQLLLLAVRKDYLPRGHRLGEVLVNERTYEAAPSITIHFGNLHGFCGILPNFGHRCFEFG